MLHPNTFRRKPNAGQAVMLFALAFGIMAGVLGLVLDGGRIYYERNRVQMAADAGAISGVQELRRGYNASASGFNDRVIDDIELHGFSASNATIGVYNPPQSGAHVGDGLYVEAEVSYQVPTTFMRIFGPQYSTVSARSVAGLERAGDPCIIVLNETAPDAFKTNGTIALNSNCGVMVNSDAPAYAARNTGSGCISVTWFGVTGGWDGSCITPTPKSGLTRVIDPLKDLAQPSQPANAGSKTSVTRSDGSKWTIFTPGYYNSPLQVNNGFDNAFFQPGLYYLKQGMHITGGNVYGEEVTFYDEDTSGNKAIDISTQSTNTIVLKAPTSGSYKGMLFWYNRYSAYTNNGSRIARGSADSFYSGAFYFPSTHLDWAGNPDNNLISHWTMVIANTLNISGDALVSVYRVSKPTKDQAPPSFAAVMFE